MGYEQETVEENDEGVVEEQGRETYGGEDGECEPKWKE